MPRFRMPSSVLVCITVIFFVTWYVLPTDKVHPAPNYFEHAVKVQGDTLGAQEGAHEQHTVLRANARHKGLNFHRKGRRKKGKKTGEKDSIKDTLFHHDSEVLHADTLKSPDVGEKAHVDILKSPGVAVKAHVDPLNSPDLAEKAHVDTLKSTDVAAKAQVDTLKSPGVAEKAHVDKNKDNPGVGKAHVDTVKAHSVADVKRANAKARARIQKDKTIVNNVEEVLELSMNNTRGPVGLSNVANIHKAARAKFMNTLLRSKSLRNSTAVQATKDKIKALMLPSHNISTPLGKLGRKRKSRDIKFNQIKANVFNASKHQNQSLTFPSNNTVPQKSANLQPKISNPPHLSTNTRKHSISVAKTKHQAVGDTITVDQNKNYSGQTTSVQQNKKVPYKFAQHQTAKKHEHTPDSKGSVLVRDSQNNRALNAKILPSTTKIGITMPPSAKVVQTDKFPTVRKLSEQAEKYRALQVQKALLKNKSKKVHVML